MRNDFGTILTNQRCPFLRKRDLPGIPGATFRTRARMWQMSGVQPQTIDYSLGDSPKRELSHFARRLLYVLTLSNAWLRKSNLLSKKDDYVFCFVLSFK